MRFSAQALCIPTFQQDFLVDLGESIIKHKDTSEIEMITFWREESSMGLHV